MRMAPRGRSAGWSQGAAGRGPRGPPRQPPRRDDGDGDNDGRTGALTLTRTRTKKPSMYKVLMLNDDYTPMEFVVARAASASFSKNREEATQIMLHVHQKGVGICGVYHLRDRRDEGDAGDRSTPASTSTRCSARWRKVVVEIVRVPSRGSDVHAVARTSRRALHRAFGLAGERRHEYATLEHLLLALTEDEDAMPVSQGVRRRYRSPAARSRDLRRQPSSSGLRHGRRRASRSRPPASSASSSAPPSTSSRRAATR